MGSFERVPMWLRWASDINPFKFSVDLMMIIIMQGNVVFECDKAATSGDGSKAGEGCVETSSGTSLLSGRNALTRHGITSDPWHCVLVISAVLVIFRLVAFGLLWR